MTKTNKDQQNTDCKETTENGHNENMEFDSSCENGNCDNVADEDQGSDISSEAEENDWKDKYLRLSAEFDNYRRRTLKEKANLALLGGEKVIKSILPVLDDMDRALDAMQTADDIDSVRSGIELISQKLNDMLKSQGLEEIEALGSELDTDFHEAVAQTPAPKKSEKGKVVDIAQKGYTYKEKVIRHAKVVVGS